MNAVVPSIGGNSALDVLIGLFFIFFLPSIVCSSPPDGETNAKDLYAHWRIQALTKLAARVFRRVRDPSSMPARAFASTLLDRYAPAVAGQRTLVSRATHAIAHASAPTLGAPFWFDLLGKVANLRGGGPATKGAALPFAGPQTEDSPAANN
jgi:hypothetical protein